MTTRKLNKTTDIVSRNRPGRYKANSLCPTDKILITNKQLCEPPEIQLPMSSTAFPDRTQARRGCSKIAVQLLPLVTPTGHSR
ncbi:hypothetical protein RRG08_046426 [Elysia crispata]|uniref:Uncharacterized protein n=1 Tax=Elysia crispata TaxID=231223 RepID=A0AAE0ZA12_9GAST|nr:hypothetical protein RRG08_046426 [Elysia crispata]